MISASLNDHTDLKATNTISIPFSLNHIAQRKMTTFYDPESPLKVARITAFVDTLLSLTEAVNMSDLPCFVNARDGFVEQLTDGQLDHIIGRILQLDLTLKGRYDYLDWLRGYLDYEEHVDFSECE